MVCFNSVGRFLPLFVVDELYSTILPTSVIISIPNGTLIDCSDDTIPGSGINCSKLIVKNIYCILFLVGAPPERAARNFSPLGPW